MSKKSRRRNKKILAALALAGGAAMLGRGKGMSGKETISDAQKAHNFAVAPKTNYINKKVVGPVDDSSIFDTRFSKPREEIISKADRVKNLQKNIAANYQRSQTFDARPRYGPLSKVRVNEPGTPIIRQYKKGGRVTGIAKRGFGRALMKGKK